VELQGRLKELREQGLGVAGISYDSQEILAAFSRQRGVTFPLLADVGSTVIKRFGILNPVPEQAIGENKEDPLVKSETQKYVSVVQPRAMMVGMAFPGTFVVDRQGRVTARFFEDFYVERNTISSLLLRLGGKSGETVAATKVSTAHLEVTAYPSDAAIAAGNRFSVALDIQPHAKIHVYAPGAKGYRAIAMNVEPQGLFRVLPMKYPASEIYHFKPLNERVPVFQKPFRLVQDLVLEGTQQAQAELRGKESVTVKGTLEYQACDDRICYNPVSVPLSWTLSLRSLVAERPTASK
jgi:peroxiredoxin